MTRFSGSNRRRRHLRALRNGSTPCPGGDCLCDRHEGVTDHRHSRAVAHRRASRELAADA